MKLSRADWKEEKQELITRIERLEEMMTHVTQAIDVLELRANLNPHYESPDQTGA